MKFVLKTTTWASQKDMAVELYLVGGTRGWHVTTKLSGASMWDTEFSAVAFMKIEQINDYKVVTVTEKKLFEARLKGK